MDVGNAIANLSLNPLIASSVNDQLGRIDCHPINWLLPTRSRGRSTEIPRREMMTEPHSTNPKFCCNVDEPRPAQ